MGLGLGLGLGLELGAPLRAAHRAPTPTRPAVSQAGLRRDGQGRVRGAACRLRVEEAGEAEVSHLGGGASWREGR